MADAHGATRYLEDSIADDWMRAVLRSIGVMRENLGNDHSLRTLAEVAWLSPFHFHRVFHRVTDSTPARFLAAWRMAEAKRLLAFSPDSVTDICMRIGYSSLGTFTSQFTRMVGVSPGRFRRLLAARGDRPFNDTLAALGGRLGGPARVQLTVAVSGGPVAPVAVGLFPTGIPQQQPAACAVVWTPGSAALGDLPDGVYHPLAMCFDPAVTVAEAAAMTDLDGCFVAAADDVVSIVDGCAASAAAVPLRLRPRRQTDPPVVLALPLLLEAA
ncbi:MAG TPA: AraC family transcriptional regulator [Rugosimonospora sp.]|nr:AraC family transcriptional regulator [Rugosimonospora sp.]